jgi:PAS domain S-box-containing protein
MRDFLHVLTSDGRIVYASPSCKTVTGFEPTELEGRFVSAFIHPDDLELFISTLMESVLHAKPVRFFYRFRQADWGWKVLEANGHAHFSHNSNLMSPAQRLTTCRGFLMMARPYLSSTTTLLDSFLEHAIEHQRLLARISELRNEEQSDQAAVAHTQTGMESSLLEIGPEACASMANDSPGGTNQASLFQMSTGSIAASTTQHLSRTSTDCDDDDFFMETFDQLTDLGYSDKREAQTIEMSCSVKGDAGIDILVRSSKSMPSAKINIGKKKQARDPRFYICIQCSTVESPEWRKGPNGPKTLCNACGCRLIKYKGCSIVTNRASALGKTEKGTKF